jgi:hypothetical protein
MRWRRRAIRRRGRGRNPGEMRASVGMAGLCKRGHAAVRDLPLYGSGVEIAGGQLRPRRRDGREPIAFRRHEVVGSIVLDEVGHERGRGRWRAGAATAVPASTAWQLFGNDVHRAFGRIDGPTAIVARHFDGPSEAGWREQTVVTPGFEILGEFGALVLGKVRVDVLFGERLAREGRRLRGKRLFGPGFFAGLCRSLSA